MLYRSPLVLTEQMSRTSLRLISEMDDRLRELERRAASGDPDAKGRLSQVRVRSGHTTLLGGQSGQFQHVPNSTHQDNTDYRDGYKAGWSHAHRNPGTPPQPDKSRGPQYIQGYRHGHEIGGHASKFAADFSPERFRARTHEGIRALEVASHTAAEHLIKPHLSAIKSAYRDRVNRAANQRGAFPPSAHGLERSLAEADKRVDDWASSREPGHIRYELNGPTPTRAVAAVQTHISNVEDGFNHPADFAVNIAKYSLPRIVLYH